MISHLLKLFWLPILAFVLPYLCFTLSFKGLSKNFETQKEVQETPLALLNSDSSTRALLAPYYTLKDYESLNEALGDLYKDSISICLEIIDTTDKIASSRFKIHTNNMNNQSGQLRLERLLLKQAYPEHYTLINKKNHFNLFAMLGKMSLSIQENSLRFIQFIILLLLILQVQRTQKSERKKFRWLSILLVPILALLSTKISLQQQFGTLNMLSGLLNNFFSPVNLAQLVAYWLSLSIPLFFFFDANPYPSEYLKHHKLNKRKRSQLLILVLLCSLSVQSTLFFQSYWPVLSVLELFSPLKSPTNLLVIISFNLILGFALKQTTNNR